MKPRTRRIWKTIAAIGAALAVAYAGLTAWSFVALHRAYAALARDGRPMTIAEVMPPPIPESDNAAPLYEAALKILKTEKIGGQTLLERLHQETDRLSFSNRATTASLTGFRDLITTPAAVEAMALIAKGALRKGCRFDPIEIRESNGDLEPEWFGQSMAFLSLSTIVKWEATRLVVGGDPATAHRMTLIGLRLAEVHMTRSLLCANLCEIASRAEAMSAVRTVCRRAPPSEYEACLLASELRRLDDPISFESAMDGERLVCEGMFFTHEHSQKTYMAASGLNRTAARLYTSKWNPLLRLDHAAYLDTMRKVAIPLGGTPAHLDVPSFCRFTRTILPNYEQARKTFTAHLARVRCTEAGLAVLVFRKEHGAWPETLAACMGQVPLDPFDGQPLRYRLTEKGFVVSSAGKTGKPPKEIAWDCVPQGVE